jgi:hypothetical protein
VSTSTAICSKRNGWSPYLQTGELNSLAWEYYEHFNPVVMTLSRFATDGQVINAVCADQRNPQMTMPKGQDAYQLAALYNGWQFANVPSC